MTINRVVVAAGHLSNKQGPFKCEIGVYYGNYRNTDGGHDENTWGRTC